MWNYTEVQLRWSNLITVYPHFAATIRKRKSYNIRKMNILTLPKFHCITIAFMRHATIRMASNIPYSVNKTSSHIRIVRSQKTQKYKVVSSIPDLFQCGLRCVFCHWLLTSVPPEVSFTEKYYQSTSVT